MSKKKGTTYCFSCGRKLIIGNIVEIFNWARNRQENICGECFPDGE